MQRISRFLRVVVPPFLMHCALSEVATAQQTVNYASASGRVTDPSDALVAGASVSARETQTGVRSNTTSDSEGRFRFPYLKPGPYEIEVRAAGFNTAGMPVTLKVGSAADLIFQLTVASIETKANVSGQTEGLKPREHRSQSPFLKVRSRIFRSMDAIFWIPHWLFPGSLRPTRRAINSFPRRQRLPGRGCPSTASAISQIATLWTDFPPTMTRPA
jgi:hypothetical protein